MSSLFLVLGAGDAKTKSRPCPGGAPTELASDRQSPVFCWRQHSTGAGRGPRRVWRRRAAAKLGEAGEGRQRAGGIQAPTPTGQLCVCVCLSVWSCTCPYVCPEREGRKYVCLTGTHSSNKSSIYTAPLLCHVLLALSLGHLMELSQYAYDANIIPNLQRQKLRCRGAR